MYITVSVYATPTPHQKKIEIESQYHLIFIDTESHLQNCQTKCLTYERFFNFYQKGYI